MSRRQAAWAAQHDWFIRARINEAGTITVVVHDWVGVKQFYDYEELRAWAGY